MRCGNIFMLIALAVFFITYVATFSSLGTELEKLASVVNSEKGHQKPPPSPTHLPPPFRSRSTIHPFWESSTKASKPGKQRKQEFLLMIIWNTF